MPVGNFIITQPLNNNRRLLLFDQAGSFSNEVFRILTELLEHNGVDTPENFSNALAGEIGVASKLTQKVVLDHRVNENFIALDRSLLKLETLATLELDIGNLLFLSAGMDGILERADPQLLVQCTNTVANQFRGVKLNPVDSLMVDPVPELLELFFVEVVVQRIRLWLPVVSHLG